MKKFWCLFAALAVVSLASAPSQAAIVFSDSFNRTTGSSDTNGNPAGAGNGFSDWGTNDNASGGTVAQAWLTGPGRGGGANQATDGSVASTIEGGAFFDFDVTTVAPDGFTVGFEFNRFHPINTGSGNGFMAIGLGVDTGTAIGGGAFATNNADFALLFQQGAGGNVGNTQFFQDGAFLPGTGSEGPVDYGDPTATHSVLLSFTPAASGAYGDADVINGTVSIDGSSPFAFSTLGGANFGSISFSSNGFVHRQWDNLVVNSVPEPSSALFGVIALGFTALRRRRSA